MWIAFGLLIVWGIRQFLLPALSYKISGAMLALTVVASTSIGFLACLNGVVEIGKWLFLKEEGKTAVAAT